MIFTTGDQIGEQASVSDYDGTTKVLTYTPAIAGAPAADDTFELLVNPWSSGSLQRAVGAHTQLLYVAQTDEIYALGHGYAWVMPRTSWPTGASTDLDVTGHYVATDQSPGLTYYEPENLILMWDDGQTIETIDPTTHEWGTITPGGVDPGDDNSSGGTFGRFSYCDGVLGLLNGTNEPFHYVETSP
jgi:hypothetical protein